MQHLVSCALSSSLHLLLARNQTRHNVSVKDNLETCGRFKRTQKGWNVTFHTPRRRFLSQVSTCLDHRIWYGPHSSPLILFFYKIPFEIWTFQNRLDFVRPFLSLDEVFAHVLLIILTLPSHGIWWAEGQCCQSTNQRGCQGWIDCFMLCANHFRTSKTFRFSFAPLMGSNMQTRKPDHNHHHCHEESLRLRCEFKTVWWRQSTRWTSCGREWKCLQIRSFSSELRQERQNWEILVLSISWYQCDHTSDILTISARTVALISMNVRPKAGLI